MSEAKAEAQAASVLVVDDTPENIEVLTGLLKDDYKVRAAIDGPTALKLVRRFPPDIVLLDIMMPGMNGYDVCRALKEDPLTQHIPVIFITAMSDVEDERRGFQTGAVDYIAKPFSPPIVQARVRAQLALQSRRQALEQEVQARTRELAQANAALSNEINMRRQAMERAEYLFNFDPLTGLPNRHQFMDRLGRLLARAHERGETLGVVIVTLDRLHLIKTTLDGGVSDQLLEQTCRRLQQNLHPDALLARIGGEEFATVLVAAPRADGPPPPAAGDLSMRLLAVLAAPFELSSGNAEVRASVAYALFPEDGGSALELMCHAEATLEHARLSGGNHVERFDREVESAAGAAFAMETRIRQALRERALVPYYQPKLESATGRVLGAEALIRWPLPSGGMLSPGKFIPVAERSGLIGAIDELMLEQTCRQIAQWRRRFRNFRIAVNLSATAFQNDALVSLVGAALRRSGASAEHLELEITEHALITDMSVAIHKLRTLRDMGVRIALDDFGTGYSSMGYLRRLPLDVLKVDQTFVRDIETDRHAAAIVRAIITMAQALELDVVAEGVESEAQLEFITAHGGNVAVQGWVYCPALPAERMEQVLAQGIVRPGSFPQAPEQDGESA